MGLETAAIIGIASVAAGGVASVVSSSSTARKNKEMQDKALQSQQNMFVQQNAEYDRRFAKEAEYNDPKSVISRNAQAGLNPVFGLGGSSVQNFGAPSPAVQSAPPPSTPPYTNLSGSADLGNVLEKVGSFASDVAGAFKDTAEGSRVARTTAGLVNNVELQNRLIAAQEYGKSLENMVSKQTSLKSALNNLAIQRSQLQLNILKGFNVEEDTLLKQFQQFTEQCKQKMSSAEYARFVSLTPVVLSNEKALLQVYRDQAKMYSASADLSSAGAEKARQETKTEIDLRKWKVENLRLENEGKSVSNIFAAASQDAKLNIIKANLSEAQFEARMAEIRKMDMEGYSALHRLLFSDTHQGGDFKKAANLMQKQAFRDALGL